MSTAPLLYNVYVIIAVYTALFNDFDGDNENSRRKREATDRKLSSSYPESNCKVATQIITDFATLRKIS
jgi:hypothetical protein